MTFIGLICDQGVYLQDLRCPSRHQLNALARSLYARFAISLVATGRRTWAPQLPKRRRAGPFVLCHEIVQKGAAGPAEVDDKHRTDDWNIPDFRKSREVLLQL